jgi:hypothetical protein
MSVLLRKLSASEADGRATRDPIAVCQAFYLTVSVTHRRIDGSGRRDLRLIGNYSPLCDGMTRV